MTRIIGYVASTLNGIIATEKGSEDFILAASWKRFVALAKKCGCMIQGRTTWEIIKGFRNEFKGVEIAVISRAIHRFLSERDKYDFPSKLIEQYPEIQPSPEAAVEYLEKKGFKTILVGGGAQTFGAFLERDLLDEMWVDIEPVVLGRGPSMFGQVDAPGGFRRSLRLISCEPHKDEIVVKYRVVKEAEYESWAAYGSVKRRRPVKIPIRESVTEAPRIESAELNIQVSKAGTGQIRPVWEPTFPTPKRRKQE